MNKKITIIKKLVLILNIFIYIYIVFIGRNQYMYDMSYSRCILFMLLLSLFIYVCGISEDRDKSFKTNINIYLILFFILLFSVTFIIGRDRFHLYSWSYGGQMIPFRTIKSQIKYGSSLSILKNLIGNCIMLIPLSFLLMIKNKKYNNILRQTPITLPLIIFIEILQTYTHTGTFDIDDIILNYLGTIIFTFIITRFNLIEKIKKLFYTDYKFNEKLKNYLLYFSLILIIIFDILLFI